MKNLIIKRFSFITLVFLQLCFGCSAEAQIKLFPKLGDALLSNQFEIKINNQEAFVERMEKLDIPINYTQLTYDTSVPLEIEITIDNPIKTYSISPQRKKLTGIIENNKLTFVVHDADYLLVKINDLEDLFLLINPLVDYKAQIKNKEIIDITSYGIDKTGQQIETQKLQQAINDASLKQAVLYFPKGIYRTGQLNMRSNMTVYLSDDALIYGSTNPKDYADDSISNFHYTDKSLIRMDSISNFQLLGNGTIDGAGWAGLRQNGGWHYLIFTTYSKNVIIDGPVLRDPAFWNTRIYCSNNIHLKNIKILNNRPDKDWSNTDGVDFDSSSGCSLVNAVIHAGDDNLVVKGMDTKRRFVTENILFDNILTLSNSAAAKIGTETSVAYFKDITFRNIDVIRCKRGLVITGYDSTDIENVLFENFTIENFDFVGHTPSLIDFEISDQCSWRETLGRCTINNVKIRNINVLCSIDSVNSQLLGRTNQFDINNVKFKNIQIQGKKVAKRSDINLKTNEFVKNLIVK